MTQAAPDFYSHWLERHRQPSSHFSEDAPPPERWLQHLWRHQRIQRDSLSTQDGTPFVVLHPGFLNRSAGPDFKQAVLQFHDHPPVSGDIEVDVEPLGWTGHRHHANPAYRNVILHVVWDRIGSISGRPVLSLKPVLDAPLPDLIPWLLGEAPRVIPPAFLGRCCAPLRQLHPGRLESILRQAARHRLARKAGEFAIRARHAGWEQALWEGLLAGLGYRHNTWPLRRIAELIPISENPVAIDPDAAQARLLGLGGFLPDALHGANATYIRGLWDHWWRDRGSFAGRILPAEVWRLGGLRPANHPQRRLALAAHWHSRLPLSPRLIEVLLGSALGHDLLLQTAAILQPGPDPFWDHHWNLVSPDHAATGPLLGLPRITDLAMNVLLPWLWARARMGSDERVIARVEQAYFQWPAGEDNAPLRGARERLLGVTRWPIPRNASLQQGLLQISADFCATTDSLCSGCAFPEFIRAILDGTDASLPPLPITGRPDHWSPQPDGTGH